LLDELTQAIEQAIAGAVEAERARHRLHPVMEYTKADYAEARAAVCGLGSSVENVAMLIRAVREHERERCLAALRKQAPGVCGDEGPNDAAELAICETLAAIVDDIGGRE
jgi:hypothetical protein